jgi:hypothetical protein
MAEIPSPNQKKRPSILKNVLILCIITISIPWINSPAEGKELPMDNRKPNLLIKEKSPYLLQHAYNPVDWYPWSKEAFEKASRENKPIFLSIGYSTCHWCHVMERESFEDPAVARLMNEAFVSIKVDREERPDLDHIYMTVCQMLTRSGGWPLTIIMTPDKKPFFAGTYIPKETRFGRTGLMELIPRIKSVWGSKREEVLQSAEKIMEALESTDQQDSGPQTDIPVLKKAYQELRNRYDKEFGGFGAAPKFPTPHQFSFLLRYWKRENDLSALEMTEKSLQAMQLGGMYDHIGYGFHRYSTDREWLVPHFEKMLYDQAMLALAYLETYQASRGETCADTAREIFTYVLRDMTDPEGGFYSAEDADSEGVEGKFYVWKDEDIRRVLGKDAGLFVQIFNVKREGNFQEEATGEGTGANILHMKKPLSGLATDLGISSDDLKNRLERMREQLFQVREARVHPHKDDKILTDWNGLMIAALARGARVLGQDDYAVAAKKAAAFILKTMRGKDGRLLHRYRDGEAGIHANLDDYAFLTWGLIELYEATYEPEYLKTAVDLNDEVVTRFWDKEKGGFFFAPDDGDDLIVRKKEVYDGATPSGNSIAMLNLLRLSHLTGSSDLEDRAARLDRAFSSQIGQLPSGYTQFLVAVDFGIGPAHEVVIVGDRGARDTARMLQALNTPFLPNTVTLFRAAELKNPPVDQIAPFVATHEKREGKATAYVCTNTACTSPVTDVAAMLKLLR